MKYGNWSLFSRWPVWPAVPRDEPARDYPKGQVNRPEVFYDSCPDLGQGTFLCGGGNQAVNVLAMIQRMPAGAAQNFTGGPEFTVFAGDGGIAGQGGENGLIFFQGEIEILPGGTGQITITVAGQV